MIIENPNQEEELQAATKRIKLTVAYDGTAYHGWQYQENANTIEGELNRCLSGLLNERIMVIGASRTDTGVHALCNIAVFDTASKIPPAKFAPALNQRLPEDIKVMHAEAVDPLFHPRRQRCEKTYRYTILNAETDPTKRLYVHFVPMPLNLDKMRQGAAYLLGEHDFTSFCSVKGTAKSNVRTIHSIEISRVNEEIRIDVCGGGFLYHMVRIIAGTLIEVGRGRYAPEAIGEILVACDRTKAGPTAPAKGLMLINFRFF